MFESKQGEFFMRICPVAIFERWLTMINAIIVVGIGLIYFDICNNIIRRVIKKK